MTRWIVERVAWLGENWPWTVAGAVLVGWMVMSNLRLDRLERWAGIPRRRR